MLEALTIEHPGLDPALHGLRVLHLTDFHVRWTPERHRWFPAMLDAIRAAGEVDLVALTGDYHDKPGQEEHGLELIRAMAGVWHSRLGAAGIFGNHDSPEFRRRALATDLGVSWIGGRTAAFGALTLAGMDSPEDVLSLGLDTAGRTPSMVLAHEPTVLMPCAELGWPLILAGHTHGGQIRIPTPRGPYALHTSSDTPGSMASGLLRFESTICAVGRGVGDGVVEGLRINCPRQVAVYELKRV